MSTIEPSTVAPLSQAPGLLSLPGFRRFLWAMFCFTAAMQIANVAQGWLVFEITGSSVALGVVTSLWSVVMLVASPFGGVIADRMDRKMLIAVTWGASAAIFGLLAFLIFTDNIQVWHMALAAALHGLVFSVNIPARFVLISQMVSDLGLTRALALVALVFNLNGVLFALLGGGIIDLVGADGAYAAVALLYGLSAGVITLVPAAKGVDGAKRNWNVLAELATGVRAIRASRTIMVLTGLALAAVVLGQTYQVLLPKFAAETLGVPASGLGLLMAMMALGSFVGNGVVANFRPGAPLGRWMFVLGIMSGVSLIALGLVRGMYFALGALFLTGLAGGPFFTINQTLVQRLSPVEVRGRVLSLWMLTWGAMPLGIMGFSALGDQIGLWFPMVLGGASLVLVMVAVLFAYPALLRVAEGTK